MKKIFYGFGGLSYSVIGQTVSSFFMFFATSVLGMKGTIVGIAIAISTIWDGISDTIIGHISDNYSMGILGRRNGYMLIATIGMSIANIILWCVPIKLSSGLKFVWLLLSLLLLETFNTMFSTPYMALGNELADSDYERTKYGASNTIFFLIGMIIPSILMVVFLPSTVQYPVGQLNPKGYVKISIVSSVICLLCGLISSLGTLNRRVINKFLKREKLSISGLLSNFVSSFQDSRINKIIWGYVLTSIATVFLCSVGMHFFTYCLFYTSNEITILLLTLIIGTIISQPLWVKTSKDVGKKNALIIGIFITIIAIFTVITVFLLRIALYPYSFYFMLVCILICGIGSGAMYTLPSSLYGDAITSLNSGREGNIASYTASMTFAGNMANSIAQLVIGVLLDIISFDSSLEVQSFGVQTGIALILFVGIQMSLILAGFIFSKYNEKNKKRTKHS